MLGDDEKRIVKFKKLVRQTYKFLLEDNSRSNSRLELWIQACSYASHKMNGEK